MVIRQHCSQQIWLRLAPMLPCYEQSIIPLWPLHSPLGSPFPLLSFALCFRWSGWTNFFFDGSCVWKMIKSLMVRNKSGLASFTVSRVFHEIGQLHFCTLNNISHEYCPVAENISLAGFDLHMDSNTWKHQWSNSLQQCRASIIYQASFIHKCRR